MKPHILILSILLAVSVIFNIVLLKSGDAPDNGKKEIEVVTSTDINDLENISSRLYADLNRSSDRNIDWVVASSKRFLMKLDYLKKVAKAEGASETVDKIDGMIGSTKTRLDKLAERTGVDISDSNRSPRETTYQQREERRKRLLDQQRPVEEEPNSR